MIWLWFWLSNFRAGTLKVLLSTLNSMYKKKNALRLLHNNSINISYKIPNLDIAELEY